MAQISASASSALTNAFSVIACTSTTTAEAQAQPMPDSCFLQLAHLELSSIVTATTVTWHLCADAAGDIPLTHSRTTSIVTGITTTTDGAVTEIAGISYVRFIDGVGDSIYLAAKLNAGTASAIARVTWDLSP